MHLPGSLARSVLEAQEHHAALLSYSPAQEVHGFWERAIMPVVFAELTATFRTEDVNNPASPVAAANGQYLLIRRDVYQSIGGFASVSQSLLEDVDLARAVKRAGHRLYFRFGGDAVRTRMYRSFADLRQGWTKNLALLFPSPGQLAVKRALEFLLVLLGAITALIAVLKDAPALALSAGALAATAYVLFLRRVRRAHAPFLAQRSVGLGDVIGSPTPERDRRLARRRKHPGDGPGQVRGLPPQGRLRGDLPGDGRL